VFEREFDTGCFDRTARRHAGEEPSGAIDRDFLGDSARDQLNQHACNRHAVRVRELLNSWLRFASNRMTLA
jgi:hypothetical protein